MAQHDYVIDNSTGANVRADINSALLAISSNNSGSSAPSTTYALQSFANTSDSMLQLRNAANNAFVNIRKFDGSLPLPDGSASSPSLFFDDDTNTGIFSSAADTLDITTGGSTAITVDSSQNVGIGTSPQSILSVKVSASRQLDVIKDSGDDHLVLKSTAPDASFNLRSIELAGADVSFSTGASSGTSYTEAMNIDNNQNVGIGTSSPSHKLHTVIGAGESNGVAFLNTNSQGLNFYVDTTANNADVFIDQGLNTSSLFFASAGTKRMTISQNGDIGAPSGGDNIFDASDERIKENMVELTDGLSKINKLKPISYNYKVGWNKDTEGKTKYGFGAQTTQEVDELLIESFSNNDVELQGVKISNILRVNEKFITPVLVKAIQELSAKVTTLETENAKLQTDLTSLTARVAALEAA